jgi:hypothetical protein
MRKPTLVSRAAQLAMHAGPRQRIGLCCPSFQRVQHMRKRHEVSIGEIYREAGQSFLGAARRSWAVDEVRTSFDGQTHAIISSADFLRTRKTLSVAALLDKSRYELVPADVENRPAVGVLLAAG